MWMSALQTTGAVNTRARTSRGPSSVAARLDTSCMKTEGAASVSASRHCCTSQSSTGGCSTAPLTVACSDDPTVLKEPKPFQSHQPQQVFYMKNNRLYFKYLYPTTKHTTTHLTHLAGQQTPQQHHPGSWDGFGRPGPRRAAPSASLLCQMQDPYPAHGFYRPCPGSQVCLGLA